MYLVSLHQTHTLTPSIQIHFFLPIFLISCGGILVFNGLQIHEYYKTEEHDKHQDVFVRVVDVAQSRINDDTPRIHGDDNYIVVEFAGAIASGFFYVSS